MQLNNIQINESLNLRIGDVLKLNNNLQGCFSDIDSKKLKYFEYLGIAQSKDFKSVDLYYEYLKKNGGNAPALFSSTESSIKKIIPNSKRELITVITELFEIRIFEAIKNNEVILKANNLINKEYHQVEIELMKDLQEIEENHIVGFITIQEKDSQKDDLFQHAFYKMKVNGKWK